LATRTPATKAPATTLTRCLTSAVETTREAALAALRADVDKLAALAEAACVTQQPITLEQVQEATA
jgi:hypothetical protein